MNFYQHKRKSGLVFFAAVIAAFMFASCKPEKVTEKTEKPVIMTSVFPLYDWTKNLVKDQAEVKLLMKSGSDFHSWQPSAKDILEIISSDIFIHIGGESDFWVEDVFRSNPDSKTVELNCMSFFTGNLIEEEPEEQQEYYADEEFDNSNGQNSDENSGYHRDEQEIEYDEHIWLSLKNAAVCIDQIAGSIISVYPELEETVRMNAKAYKEQLEEIDKYCIQSITEKRSAGITTSVVFADRYPFSYFMRDYGIEVCAAFPGCSSDINASFEVVSRLAGFIDRKNIGTVLVSETSDFKLADTVINNTKTKTAEIRILNSMQKITPYDIETGTTYHDVMQTNVEVLLNSLP